MRIAIIGAGAVGAYFGAHLAAAGNDVVFVARGKHLVALQNNGLLVRGARGDQQVASSAFVSPSTPIGSVDVVLLCVKLYDLESSIELARPLVDQGAVCVTLQNGVDAQDRAAALLGDGHVMGGAAFVSAVIESPGVIRYTSAMSSIIFGEKDGSLSARALALEAVCKAAGFEAKACEDIKVRQWTKFVGLATNAALTSLTRQPAGYVYHDSSMLPFALASIAEVESVARAAGIALPIDIASKTLALLQSFPSEMYASMYHDLAAGKRLELDSLSGYIVRLGGELGVATPVHGLVYACLKPYAAGSKILQ